MLKRKFIALLLAIAAVSPAFGQSLVVEAYDSLVIGDATTANDIYGYATVKNVSSDTILVRFKRIDGNYNLLTDNNAICWGICFIESISVSPPSYSVYLGPGDTASASTHVYPDQDGIARQGDITYVFFNSDDETDTATYSVTYKTTTDISLKDFSVEPKLSVYPNPATDRLEVNYTAQSAQKTSFEIINLVGSKVYSKSLQAAESSFNLNISNLNAGIYFCVLKVDNKLVTSKKLVVN
jgi:hypothetical protein